MVRATNGRADEVPAQPFLEVMGCSGQERLECFTALGRRVHPAVRAAS